MIFRSTRAPGIPVRAIPISATPRLLAIAASILLSAVLVLPPAPAAAAEYPTWSQVANARASEATAQTLVTQIQTQLGVLTQQATQTAAIAETRGGEYQIADQAFQESAFKASKLQVQARAAAMFTDTGRTDDLLTQLGLSTRITTLAGELYAKATREHYSSQALTDQAERAKSEREKLRQAASTALSAATSASAAADAAVEEQTTNQADLQAQLAVLTQIRVATENDYAAGEAARAAARAAQAARKTAGSGPAGIVSSQGWANPTTGRIVSPYGYRIHPITREYKLHTGIDIADGCDIPIYAATGGRVVFSGGNGGFGNFILIDHGNGIQSAYAHIINGGRLVANGQSVAAGQLIARTGSTGASTGCHLHFEIRDVGATTDPAPFMRARGVSLG